MRIVTELFSCGSRALNVLTGGRADWTLSARAHRDGLWIERVIDLLFFWEGPGHCARWYDDEIARSAENVRLHNKRHQTKE
ncbi:MAG: hypothetical protein M0R28_20465 [Pigmentiphaga sp.]|nr:hypothetical protein [Pigmentiphaga sp.]